MSREYEAVKTPVPEWAYAALPVELAEQARLAESLVRSPEEVLQQPTMHGMVATNQSFAQSLARRMTSNRWKIELVISEINHDSTGFMAYEMEIEGVQLSFGVFVYPPFDPDGPPRLFRDTETELLAMLMYGPIDRERFFAEQKQFDEAVWRGRSDSKVIAWTIASRGSRTFDRISEALEAGRQPKVSIIDQNGGYILRNGGFYANGRMGTAAWVTLAERVPALSRPYHIDMFGLYLWRLVSFDLVEATARVRSEQAVPLDQDLKRHIGIGNSSGMGTVAALIRWPMRTASFILAREVAFAYAKSRPLTAQKVAQLSDLLDNAAEAYDRAPVADVELVEPRGQVSAALRRVRGELSDGSVTDWVDAVERTRANGSIEASEVLMSQLLEIFPETLDFERIIDKGASRPFEVDPSMTVNELREIMETACAWALKAELEAPGGREYFWYRSEENGENRRGERSIDLGVERETFTDVAGSLKRLYEFLLAYPGERSVARFLLEEPEFTQAVARSQLAGSVPFSEVCESITSLDFLAANGIRTFLAVLGIELPTPASRRWVRGLFYRGAPLPEDMLEGREYPWGIGAAAYQDETVGVES